MTKKLFIANPNATNSEMDSKQIINNVELTDSQRDELTRQFAELVADNMDTKDLVRYAIDGMIEYFNTGSLDELREEVNTFDENLFDELVDNVSNREVKWEWFELLMMSYMTSLSYMIS